MSERLSGNLLVDADYREFLHECINTLECCARCRYWHPLDGPAWGAGTIPDGELPTDRVDWHGDCRRHAPANLASEGDREVGVGWQFPMTNYNVWCGDFTEETGMDRMAQDHRDSLVGD